MSGGSGTVSEKVDLVTSFSFTHLFFYLLRSLLPLYNTSLFSFTGNFFLAF